MMLDSLELFCVVIVCGSWVLFWIALIAGLILELVAERREQ